MKERAGFVNSCFDSWPLSGFRVPVDESSRANSADPARHDKNDTIRQDHGTLKQLACTRLDTPRAMTLRIDKRPSEDGLVVQLIGNLGIEHLAEVKAQVYVAGYHVLMDVGEVTLVSVEGIRFLNACQDDGIAVINASPYILEVDDTRTQNRATTDVVNLKLWPSASQSGATADAGSPFATGQVNFQRPP